MEGWIRRLSQIVAMNVEGQSGSSFSGQNGPVRLQPEARESIGADRYPMGCRRLSRLRSGLES